MSKFNVEQIVLCEVRVWYTVEANNHTQALEIVAKNDCPTDRSMDGTDYEIISDTEILKTKVEVTHE
jgi:hypothetical protein